MTDFELKSAMANLIITCDEAVNMHEDVMDGIMQVDQDEDMAERLKDHQDNYESAAAFARVLYQSLSRGEVP